MDLSRLRGYITLKVKDKDGNIKQEIYKKNKITDEGIALLQELIANDPAQTGLPTVYRWSGRTVVSVDTFDEAGVSNKIYSPSSLSSLEGFACGTFLPNNEVDWNTMTNTLRMISRSDWSFSPDWTGNVQVMSGQEPCFIKRISLAFYKIYARDTDQLFSNDFVFWDNYEGGIHRVLFNEIVFDEPIDVSFGQFIQVDFQIKLERG